MAEDAADQSEVIAFLSGPEAHDGTGPVERIDTHISHLFLAGDRALKLKRAVRLPYVDFSTVALRRRYCAAEVAVNRRTAPELYVGVAPVLRGADGGLVLGPAADVPADAEGQAVDWVVVMRRFDQDALFDALARRGGLDRALITALADVVAAFHEDAAPTPDFGGGDGMARVIAGNLSEIAAFTPDPFDRETAGRLAEETRSALAAAWPLLDARRAAGMVRHCHGDLYLRNICLIDGRPTPFDAIEFNDEIANIDVLYDFAFLLMDLEHRGRRDLANAALNQYLPREGDYDGVVLLPLFLSCRAQVRAHVTARQAAAAPADAEAAAREARSYLDLALAMLRPVPPRLVAVGGLSGTGKSHLARDLAPAFGAAPGAVVLRSDVIRKRLMGVDPLTRLGPEAYEPAVTRRVYETIRETAETVLAGGHSAIADAVYARGEERAAIEDAARRAGAAFDGMWLEAPETVRIGRIGARTADASDADGVIAAEQTDFELGEVRWTRIDASAAPDATMARAQNALHLP